MVGLFSDPVVILLPPDLKKSSLTYMCKVKIRWYVPILSRRVKLIVEHFVLILMIHA